MTEHQVAEAELDVGGAESEGATVDGEPLETFGAALPTWKEILLSNLAKLNGCKTWNETTYQVYCGRKVNQRKAFRIAGRPSDVASVRYLYAWLTLEIERLTAANALGRGRGRTFANSYRVGCVMGVVAAMKAASASAKEQASTTALAVIDSRADEAAKLLPDLDKARKATLNRDPQAFAAGTRAGHGIHSGAKLGASSGARLLGTVR